MMTGATKLYNARCHCERVKIQVETSIDKVWTCNCGFCHLRGGHWIYLQKDKVKFLQGEDYVKEYRFNTHSSRNIFCRICSIHLLCVPRVFPDQYAVRVECIEELSVEDLAAQTHAFDGIRWEENAEHLRAIEAEHSVTA